MTVTVTGRPAQRHRAGRAGSDALRDSRWHVGAAWSSDSRGLAVRLLAMSGSFGRCDSRVVSPPEIKLVTLQMETS